MRPSGSSVSIRYAFPDPRLFDCIAAIGEARVAGTRFVEDLVPPEMAMISISLSGDWKQGSERADEGSESPLNLHGPTSRAKWIGGSDGAMLAIAVHPLVWPRWFGEKAERFANKSVPFAEVLGKAAEVLQTAIFAADSFEARLAVLNQFFVDLPKRQIDDELPQRVMALRMALADPDCSSVKELCQRVGVSQTRLGRMAASCFGFPPKTLIRIARFRRMLHRADAHSYAAWREFIEGQYVDQSHMIRDFQTFLGLSPSRYFELERPFVSAAFEEARRLLGHTPFESDIKLAAE